MIARLVIASLLAGTSTAGVGQDAGRTADGSTNQWPLLQQCTLTPSGKLAIKTKGTSAQRTRAGDWDGDGWNRIDLHLSGSPGGSSGPTINAHAINTKGTGANTGRMNGSDSQGRVEVACVKSAVTGDAAAQKAAMSSFAFMSADGKGVGWSCSVSGSEDKPVFRVGTVVPTILCQGETPVILRAASWSWGVSNTVSIVPRGGETSDKWHVACSSTKPRNTNYDLAVIKKP